MESIFTEMHVFIAAGVLLLLCDLGVGGNPPQYTPDMHRFTDGTKYYRYLTVDTHSTALYAGAMEYIYRLNSDDISNRGNQFRKSDQLYAVPTEVTICEGTFNRDKDFDCKNHIRSIGFQSSGVVEVCGTGAHAPMLFNLDRFTLDRDADYPPDEQRSSGAKYCPPGPNNPYSCIFVEEGNPGNVPSVYTAILDNAGPFIYRPELRVDGGRNVDALQTEKSSKITLNDAEFIASFESEHHIYFFFNEKAVEIMPVSTVKVARVARICKSDLGGPAFILNGIWTSFVKVKLECAVGGQETFYFDELQSVQQVHGTFFALFTTPMSALNGSAVCAFSRASIDNLLENGVVLEVQDDDSWQPINDPDDKRPGKCYDDSTDIAVQMLFFVKSHPLIQGSVPMEGNKPIFYTPGTIYKKFIASSFYTTAEYIIFHMATVSGDIHKLLHNPQDGSLETQTLVKWTPFSQDVEVRQMLLYNKQIFMSTDAEIVQIEWAQCGHYATCTQCVLDPMCGWDGSSTSCKDWNSIQGWNLKQGPFSDPLQTCGNDCFKFSGAETVRVPGDPVHLRCDSVCEFTSTQWFYQKPDTERKSISLRDDKYLLTDSNGLLILNATSKDSGQYICGSEGVNLVAYEIMVPDCDNSDPDCIWKEEFRTWCNEFDSYRTQYNSWLCMKNTCLENPNCQPSDVTQCQVQP